MHGAGLLDRVGELLGVGCAFRGQSPQNQRLLADLLGHVVRIAVQAVHLFLPGDVPDAHVGLGCATGRVVHLHEIGADQSGLAVLEERQSAGVLEQRR